jgi:restriction system protein
VTAPTEAGDRARWALYASLLEQDDPAVVANAVVFLIHQANYLLDRQIAGLERDFISHGGYSERLAAARIQERERPRGIEEVPRCPVCEQPMMLRTARQGKNVGAKFWGCSGYPECKSTLPFNNSAAQDLTDQSDRSDPTDRSDRRAQPTKKS